MTNPPVTARKATPQSTGPWKTVLACHVDTIRMLLLHDDCAAQQRQAFIAF